MFDHTTPTLFYLRIRESDMSSYPFPPLYTDAYSLQGSTQSLIIYNMYKTKNVDVTIDFTNVISRSP